MIGTWTVEHDQDQWSLKVENLTYGTNDYTGSSYKGSAVVATDYPYIGVPEAVWNDLADRLVDSGFVCSSGGVAGYEYCAST